MLHAQGILFLMVRQKSRTNIFGTAPHGIYGYLSMQKTCVIESFSDAKKGRDMIQYEILMAERITLKS